VDAEDSRRGPLAPVPMTRFDEIYSRPDPRSYFAALGPLDYRTPHHAQAVFRRLVPLACGSGAPVLDVCCSYGFNAALLNHQVTWEELRERYTSPAVARMTTGELIASDRRYYAARRREDAVDVVGLDIAAPAIAYACAVGLLAAGFAENLESGAPGPALRRAARGVGLITLTGGASFLSARTFDALLAGRGEPPWVAAFVLRTGSFDAVATGLDRHGLTTEEYGGRTYPQRRFTDAGEQRGAVAAVRAAGGDPRGRECDGYFHTALHLARPAAHAAAYPLGALLRDG
jgi:SAM-dependent methyltransferase